MSKITPETVPSIKPKRVRRQKAAVAEVVPPEPVLIKEVKKPKQPKKLRKSRKLLSLSKLEHDKAVYELRLKGTKAGANPDLADYMKFRIAEIDKQISEQKYLKEK